MNDPAATQRAHFDRLIERYEAHYDDATSQQYRRRFWYAPLFAGLDLRGRVVLEAMCGSGQTTGYLLERGARVTGLEISGVAIESFRRRWPDAASVCSSILDTGLADASFDGVVVIGGLHHLHPRVADAVDEIHRLLKPGGWFCFGEPHTGSLPDVLRRWWYQRDALFEDSEAAIDIGALRRTNAGRFTFEFERYVGNLAYLLVLNSMIFRIPRGLKRFYAPPLLALERVIGLVQGRRTTCFAIGRWRKREKCR